MMTEQVPKLKDWLMRENKEVPLPTEFKRNNRLTKKQAIEIRRLLRSGKSMKQIAKDYNTSYSTIYSINKGITFNNLTED